jgi:hypothetical protein
MVNISTKNALNKIKFMTNINLLRVSTPECHSQGVFEIKAIQAQQAKLFFVNITIY